MSRLHLPSAVSLSYLKCILIWATLYVVEGMVPVKVMVLLTCLVFGSKASNSCDRIHDIEALKKKDRK